MKVPAVTEAGKDEAGGQRDGGWEGQVHRGCWNLGTGGESGKSANDSEAWHNGELFVLNWKNEKKWRVKEKRQQELSKHRR